MPKPKFSKSIQAIMDLTFYYKSQMWYDNFAVNLPVIREGKDVKELPKLKGEPILCVGAGPSIWKHNHLDLIKKWKHPIICSDKMLIPLLKNGIKPDVVCTVDGDSLVKKFYDDRIVDKYKKDVKAVFSAVTVHPQVVERCPFEKYWYINVYDDATKPRSLTAAFHFMSKKKTILVSGGTVGFFQWNLSYFLGANPIVLLGYNYSYDNLDITKSTYYKAYLRRCGWDKEKVKKYFSIRQNPYFKDWYLLDLMWKVYRDIFAFYLKKAPIQTINASEEGSLHKPDVNVKCMKFKEVLKKFK